MEISLEYQGKNVHKPLCKQITVMHKNAMAFFEKIFYTNCKQIVMHNAQALCIKNLSEKE